LIEFAHVGIFSYSRLKTGAPVTLRTKLYSAFADIIEGKFVKRSKHDLMWQSKDATALFLEALESTGYLPTRVGKVPVEPGERVPAFYVAECTAYFGWVFWEKFTDRKSRKLFGSELRNRKGDWAIQISPQRSTIVYANTTEKVTMDIERPSSV